jgi:hypothetical protein
MNETFANQARALAEYLEQDDLPELLRMDVDAKKALLQFWSDGPQAAMFLHCADTLAGIVEMTCQRGEKAHHLYARGVLPGHDFPVEIVLPIFPSDGGEFDALAEEIGDRTGAVPLTRTQLAKIADPELLDDRTAVTP